MKFLCERCRIKMEYAGSEDVEELSMGITFACPKCENRIFLVTNPGETQLVRSLGVSIGEKKPHHPLALTMAALEKRREELLWTEEAKKRLEKVPSFVRPMAEKAIEKYARERNYLKITPRIMEDAKRERGM